MQRYAEIVLPLPIDKPFTYAIPMSLATRAALGMRAVVPVRNKTETGFIVGFTNAAPALELKLIIDLPDEGPVFSDQMLALCKWIAEYYCCSWGEALQSAVPAGLRIGSKLQYRLAENALEAGRYTERQRQVIAALYKHGALTEAQLAKHAGSQALSNTLQSLARRSVVIAEPVVREAGVNIQTETWVRLIETAVPEVDALAQLQRRAPKQAAVYLDLLHGEPERAATELYTKHHVNSAILQQLSQKGLVEKFEREFYRSPEDHSGSHGSAKHTLNEDQATALSAISAALEANLYQTFLLRGITGSGKTEVYLQAIEKTLALGRDAILLVPEISLTPQTVGRFVARFHQAVAVLHSGLSQGERYDEWRRALRGEVRIVVGARSAVFAPLQQLGMIIVDEEHDSSYKQSETPRYHGRDVAIMRARMANAVCVLGSATPSLESYYNSERGKSVRLELRKRATSGKLPKVTLVDMRKETKDASGKVILSRVLEEAVHERIAKKEQVILLLNRRGHSPFVLCPQCGWIATCEYCQVSFTYHAASGNLRCHYCNAERPQPVMCDACDFNPLVYLGTGTQKAEDYLMRSFSGARIERMDADTTAGKGGHAKILGRFAAGEIDILIGTQMLAKGHDYPGVTLVGVINGDTGLAIPDFRAAEQTFQLLTQVAGRAGRGDRAGRVYIQTYRPRHYALAAAAEHDYDGFCEQEILYRKEAGYPPFRRMVNFLVDGEDPQVVERAAMTLGRVIKDAVATGAYGKAEVLGPSQAALAKIKNRYRWHAAALATSPQKLNALARFTRDAFAERNVSGKVQLKVDLDPYGFS